MYKAVIMGVGPENGLGGQLAIRFAKEGLHVYVAGRNIEKLNKICKIIKKNGNEATPVRSDATSESDNKKLFMKVGKNLKLAIYNAGNSTPGRVVEMKPKYFVDSWKVLCFGGFLFGKSAIHSFLKNSSGTLLFTGASASLRGSSNFSAFNSGKGALRNLAQAMSKEYGPEGIHVGHLIIDGPIGGERIFNRNPKYAKKLGKRGLINIHGIVDSYVYLYNQPREAWTFELDLRTSIEKW